MLSPTQDARFARWVARIWSILVLAVALLVIVAPDPNYVKPVPAVDWLLLSLWGVAILGLFVAWRWEVAGAVTTIAAMLVREVLWVVLKGPWSVGFLFVWVLVVPPAIIFLAAWVRERSAKRISLPT